MNALALQCVAAGRFWKSGWVRAFDNTPGDFGSARKNRRSSRVVDGVLKAQSRIELHKRMGWL